jgi:pSer/pThr/pTyr-binding forkhead associated (FHA) protein
MGTTPLKLHASSAVELKQRIDAERRGEPFLLYRDGDGAQQIVSLAASDRLTIGRSAQTDLPLGWDPEVSRVHAELERVGPTWTLVDDGLSRNGSYVNEERVTGRRRLTDGDVLGLGDTDLVYRAPEQSESSVTLASDRSARAAAVTESQRRVLVALCRPFSDAGAFASPATNQQIADELFLSVGAVKTHLRALFARFDIEGLPQNQKRLRLVELAFQTGAVNDHDV